VPGKFEPVGFPFSGTLVVLIPPLDAEGAGERLRRFDDVRLDEHLRALHVELTHQLGGILDAAGDVAHDDRVRTLVERDAAAVGEDALHLVDERVVGAGVVDRT
jgi:hypothetical protein